ncbi:MAG: hypothetical protein FWC61_00150 [Proteobacteria bacterium]|nr:hypothetical protein [Pseudomonadota bacterium]
MTPDTFNLRNNRLKRSFYAQVRKYELWNPHMWKGLFPDSDVCELCEKECRIPWDFLVGRLRVSSDELNSENLAPSQKTQNIFAEVIKNLNMDSIITDDFYDLITITQKSLQIVKEECPTFVLRDISRSFVVGIVEVKLASGESYRSAYDRRLVSYPLSDAIYIESAGPKILPVSDYPYYDSKTNKLTSISVIEKIDDDYMKYLFSKHVLHNMAVSGYLCSQG